MNTIKNVKFDKCDGLKNTVNGSGKQPEIIPGKKLTLCINNVLIDVETVKKTENKSRFVGIVLKIGNGIDKECKLEVGNKVLFNFDNISNLD
jgi:hypothetical protein